MTEKIFVIKCGKDLYSAELWGSTSISDTVESAAAKVAARYNVTNYEIVVCW